MQKDTITNDGEQTKPGSLSARGLWDTNDLSEYTGWGRTYISRLCNNGTLPYIPGKPNKFVPASVIKAIEAMQIGGIYGRRKSTIKRRTT